MNPKLYLCIDNCFASKRWTLPEEWMLLIKDIGLTNVEASADTECDPLYMGEDYLNRWIDSVKESTEKTGVKAAKLFSGHGTYATLGLAHTDSAARIRFRDEWIKAHARTARALGGGLGFFAHGFDEAILQEPSLYEEALETLCDDLADIAAYTKEIGVSDVGIEQMYSPHQPPWTINGTEKLLKKAYEKHGAPMYVTLDLGHMNGQQYFQRPTEKYILEMLESSKNGHVNGIWVGSRNARRIFDSAVSGELTANEAVTEILKDAEKYPHMFAEKEDCDVYGWIRKFACYSPIMHLQQSDGKSSPHWPFSEEKNKKGIIEGKKVIEAIAEAYKTDDSRIPKADSIYLTLEPFISTSGNIYDSVFEIKQSVEYWRKFIPYDGISLDEALAKIK